MAQDNIETEFKMLLNAGEFQLLLDQFPEHETIRQKNCYFDTQDEQFKKHGAALRIRTKGNERILTLKLSRDDTSKFEYEWPVKAKTIDQLTKSEIKNMISHIPFQKSVHLESLKPIACFETIRHLVQLPNAELCLDQTDYNGKADYEIEYEYLKNHDGRKEFNRILQTAGLHYEKNCPSKLARAVSGTKH